MTSLTATWPLLVRIIHLHTMAHQSPLIAIPRKTTSDADWAGPVRATIAHSFGESPDSYSEEISSLQRCRQDAVRGAGSDTTGELLMKYAS